jgi:hypothetical protein
MPFTTSIVGTWLGTCGATEGELMAGNPQERNAVPRTVLEYLLWHEEHTYEEIADRFERVAAELGERATITARRLRRLASGERSGATPITRRVLQAMFGMPADQLLRAWTDSTSRAASGAVNVGDDDSGTELRSRDREQLQKAAKRAREMTLTLSSTNVNGETMDQLYDDVSILATSYQKTAPSLVIGSLIDTQDRIFDLLEGRQPPGQTRQLFLLASVTSGLLAKISHDLADPHTAMTHSRTAYLCADNADHNGMRAWVRGLQSLIAYWAGRYRESIRYARSGAENPTRSTSGVWVPLNEARAWAALGNAEEAWAAIRRVESRRDDVSPDEVDGLGGVCTFSTNRQLYYTADALSWLPTEAADAEDYATAAVQAYSDQAAADWAFGDVAGSAADLAVSRVHQGETEGASEALRPVLALPCNQRINGIVASVDHV